MFFPNWRLKRFAPPKQGPFNAERKLENDFKFILEMHKNEILKSEELKSVAVSRKIPLYLFQTWKTLDLPEKMAENVALIKSQNPEFTHFLYDDNMCRNFIAENFDSSVLYAFDKLKPGAYKADLWRYCILYKMGGIYLDIKYSCVDGFRLHELTDKEYFVEDNVIGFIPGISDRISLRGIYQALIVALPYNDILKNCIEYITKNSVLDNISMLTPLSVTGPSLMARFIDDKDVLLSFKETKAPESIHHIFLDDRELLVSYKEYRSEQSKVGKHYSEYYIIGETYNYPTILPCNSIDFSRTHTRNITTYVSSTPSFVVISKKYMLMNISYVNHTIDPVSGKKTSPGQEGFKRLNSSVLLDNNFREVSAEFFSDELSAQGGLADVHLFLHRKKFFYMGTVLLDGKNVNSISLINPLSEKYTLPLEPVRVHDYVSDEASWSYFDSEKGVCFVTSWSPIVVVRMMSSNIASVVSTNYKVPKCFETVRGASCSSVWNNEVWFVLKRVHTNAMYTANREYFQNVVHFFGVFDENMNLLRFSEPFKFDGEKVESCSTFSMTNEHIIISHSFLDKSSKISFYNRENLIHSLRWNAQQTL